MSRPSLFVRAAVTLWVVVMLAACGHARVVRVEPHARRDVYGPSRAPARIQSQPVPFGDSVVVRPGDTLYAIATRYGLRYQDVAQWNRIDPPYSIQVGQRLRLSAPAVAPPSDYSTANPPAVAVVTPPEPTVVTPAPATTSAPPTPVAVPPRVVAPIPNDARAPVVSTHGLHWRWPTRGQLIGRFVAGDQTQQGINISGKAGQPVIAAADGVVVYSGAGLVGYGELIIIKHSDEWLSAYAHNRRRLVAEGSQVKAGEVIAELGRTGAAQDMLHFEIRRNGRPVDPLQYLPAP